MKRVSTLLYIALALFGVSCSSYLDINDNNPNTPTTVGAKLVLPNALVGTANVLNVYNTYGAQLGGYMANAGGFGGFNETVSYAYTPNNYSGNWAVAYDNAEDYQYIVDQTQAEMKKGDSSNIVFYAAARIMRVHNLQLLVDCYNNIPYTQALKGADFLTPVYDDAATVYGKLAAELDDAILHLNKANSLTGLTDMKAYDILFGGDATKWHQLANTLKLRLIVRASGKPGTIAAANATIDAVGCLSTDAMIFDRTVNKTNYFKQDNGRQNPAWNTWAFLYTGAAGNKAWMPTKYTMAFYDGTKLGDPNRGAACFYQFPATGTNQLGNEASDIPKSPNGSNWYSGADRTITAGNSVGILKGPDAAYPLLIAAESYFLQAEAVERGLMTSASTAQQLFDKGIEASFTYLYTKPDGTVSGDPTGDAAAYQSANGNKLTNYPNTTLEEKIEAIITQKYIALNMVSSQEGWNEYRRTGYPLSATSSLDATNSFASFASQATTADKLPTRILYPASEIQYNPANVPSADRWTSKIFWAK